MSEADPEAPVLVLLNCPDEDTARRLARTLVEQGLAAATNVLPGLHSWYRWEEEVRERDEVLLIAKTARDALPALAARVEALHPDALPALVALPVAAGLPAYLQWMASRGGSRSR